MPIIFLIYNYLIIPLIWLLQPFLRLFNQKYYTREKDWRQSLAAFNYLKLSDKYPRILFHSASMGEFEQAKPIIERLKANDKNIQIICSFFSPSGYINQKNYKYADTVIYLPLDFLPRIKFFFDKIHPSLAVFIRYDVWLNCCSYLKKNNIPLILANATQPGFKNPLINFIMEYYYKAVYSLFDNIYTVGKPHTDYFHELLKSDDKLNKNFQAIETLTDTRFDRIIEIVESSKKEEIFPEYIFSENDFILVAGSTWEPDEEIIINAITKYKNRFNRNIRLILVPHEPTESNIRKLSKTLEHSITLSKLLEPVFEKKLYKINFKHIIVDSIGKLSKLYKYADAAYIGGGFGIGVHSVAEAAGYGIPLVTGQNIINSSDAQNLNKAGCLKIIYNSKTLSDWLHEMIQNNENRDEIGRKARDYIYSSAGSSDIIVNKILEMIKK